MVLFTKPFADLSKHDVAQAGGKGASLGEMTRAGIPVPPGFVVLTKAFEQFLRQTGLKVEIAAILDNVKHEEVSSVERASEQIRALIFGQEIPKVLAKEILAQYAKLKSPYVAVRSSATAEDSTAAAWAGQLDSFLNTNKSQLLENVKKCWASLFTPRAIFYRFEKKMHGQNISVAVVVQKMVVSETSGIAFSVHPVTQDRNQMIIEAGYGLGEAIVSGQITPDSYVLKKLSRMILNKQVSMQERGLFRAPNGGNTWKDIPKSKGKQQVLADTEILKLGDIVLTIEQHYGFPVDVEWAMEKGKFYIVQSRPITTLTNITSADSAQILSNVIPKEKYVRLFRISAGGLKFLLSDIFAGHYKTLKCLLIADQGAWTSYLPSGVVEKTLADGLALYSQSDKFEKYRREFTAYMKTSQTFFRRVIMQKKVTYAEAEKFFALASKVFQYYCKTEFFYTDQAFQESQKKQANALRRNMKKLEQLKQDGRHHLNTILFEPAYVHTLLEQLSRQFSIAMSELEMYTVVEILALFSGKRVLPTITKKRRSVFVMISNGRQITYLTSSAARQAIHTFSLGDTQPPLELRGVSAHSGKVKGNVRVIPSDYYFDFSKLKAMMAEMKPGEILVAETTSPEMMPACKKAAGIITEQGGLLSHAAIVSREFNLPCIVQVPNVTQVLKNGDLVEVDADRGIVRKVGTPTVYQPFSDNANIDVMIRTLGVFPEEEVMSMSLFNWPGQPYHNLPNWVKYVSSGSKENPLEVYIYWDRKVEEEFQAPIRNRLVQDPKYFPWLVERFLVWFGQFKRFTQDTSQRGEPYFSGLTNTQLVTWFQRFTQSSRMALAGYYIVYDITHALIRIVQSEIDQTFPQLSPEKAQRLFEDLGIRGISSIVQDERISYLKHLQQYQKARTIELKEKVVWQQWHAFEGNAFHHRTSEPLTLSAYRRKFKKDINHNAVKELTSIGAEQKRERAGAAKLVKKVQRHQPLYLHVRWLRIMMRYRNNESLYLDTFYAHAEPLFTAISDRLKIPHEDIWYLAKEEILHGLQGRIRVKPIISDRKKRGFTIKQDGQRIRVFTGVQPEDIHEISSVSTKELTGTTAYPGQAQGPVCIVQDPQTEGHRLKKGDVLVTSMTTPEYAQLMKKASAVVTNEGGLLCHAAIVARELKKPCVIGTKIATKVLKNGDRVEVDATKGIIRKI